MSRLISRTVAQGGPGRGVAFLALLACAGIAAGNAPRADGAAGPAAADAGNCFGTVWHVDGEVIATSAAGSRFLREGDPVYVGEQVRAGRTAEAVLNTVEAGVVAVRPSAEFVPLSISAEARGSDHMSLRLIKGSLRLISGWIASLNREGVQIQTPTATIGIRGTDHEPYVLPDDVADNMPYDAGSYDKVNYGRIVLKSAAGEVEVAAGRVGFAPTRPDTGPNGGADRGLMTLLLPRLLDRVPGFYVAGRFEQDLNEYSRRAAEQVKSRLEQARAAGEKQGGCAPGATPAAVATPAATDVDAASVARNWIAHFDAAVAEHSPARVLRLFSRDAVIEAVVHDSNGKEVSTRFSRKQFASSVRAASAGLSEYHQRRDTLSSAVEGAGETGSSHVRVKSHVIEQGKMNGADYRIESDEEYLLELQDGRWLAVQATTRQR